MAQIGEVPLTSSYSTLAAHPDWESCYAQRYQDLLPRYCRGMLSECNVRSLRWHWENHGSKAGRDRACVVPPSPLPPPSPSTPPILFGSPSSTLWPHQAQTVVSRAIDTVPTHVSPTARALSATSRASTAPQDLPLPSLSSEPGCNHGTIVPVSVKVLSSQGVEVSSVTSCTMGGYNYCFTNIDLNIPQRLRFNNFGGFSTIDTNYENTRLSTSACAGTCAPTQWSIHDRRRRHLRCCRLRCRRCRRRPHPCLRHYRRRRR